AIHSGESGAKVRLYFTLPTGKGDAKYCVERLLSSKKGYTNATLTQMMGSDPAMVLEEGQSKVTTYIVDRLLQGVQYDAFVSAVFLRQEDAGRFMNLQPGDQQKQLLYLCRLEKYKKIYELAKEYRRQAGKNLAVHEQEFEQVKYATQQLLSDKRTSARELLDRIEDLKEQEQAQADILRKAQRRDALQKEMAQGERKLQTWEAILNKADEIRHADKWISEWKRVKMPVDEGRQLQRDASQLVQQIQGCDTQLTKARTAIDQITLDHKTKEDEYSKQSQALTALRKKLPELMQMRENAHQRFKQAQRARELDDRISARRKRQQEMEMQLSKLPAIEEEHRYCELLQESRQAIRHALEILHDAEAEQKTAEEQNNKARKAKKDCAQLQNALDEKKTTLTGLQQTHEKLHKKVEQAKLESKQLNDILKKRDAAIQEGKCPTCGTKIEGDISEHIHDEVRKFAAEREILDRTIGENEKEQASVASRIRNLMDQVQMLENQVKEHSTQAELAERRAGDAGQRADKNREKSARLWKEHLQAWSDIEAPDWIKILSVETSEKVKEQLIASSSVEQEYQNLKKIEIEYKAEKNELARDQQDREKIALAPPVTDAALHSLEDAFRNAVKEYGDADQQSQKLERAVTALQEEVNELRARLDKGRQYVNDWDKKHSNLKTEKSTKDKRLAQIKKTLQKEQNELIAGFPDLSELLLLSLDNNDSYTRLERLAKSYTEACEQLDELQTAESESQQLSAKINENKKEQQRLEKEVGSLTSVDAEENLRKIRAEMETLQNHYGAAQREIGGIERDHERRIALEPQMKESQDQLWAYKVIEEAVAPGSATRAAGELLASMTSQLMGSVAAKASSTLEDLGWPVALEYDRIGGFLLRDKTMATTRQYTEFSGGERFAVAISVALAIGTVTHRVGNIRCLFIDEGFGTLDTKNRKKIVDEAIKNLIQSGTRDQVVIITHLEDMQNFPRNIVLTKEDGFSVLAGQNEETSAWNL
ncbi:MAG: SbcC/MukB-like Walker B domain-containing protein, partial [bacterium]